MVIILSIQDKSKQIPRNSMTSACVILTKNILNFIIENTFHFSKPFFEFDSVLENIIIFFTFSQQSIKTIYRFFANFPA